MTFPKRTVSSALPGAPEKISFMATRKAAARKEYDRLTGLYGNVAPDQADVIVCLGGDGFMLKTLRNTLHLGVPVYGINCGSVGFMMNTPSDEHLPERLARAQSITLHPLHMHAVDRDGEIWDADALNDVYLFRQTHQAAKIRIDVDGHVRMPELVSDGVLLATPAGSTAYNLSAQGPIVPLSGNLFPLTPISPFRPRRWRGALLPHTSEVCFTVHEPEKRPVAAVADSTEIRNVLSVTVRENRNLASTLLFDPDQTLSERITAEQFLT